MSAFVISKVIDNQRYYYNLPNQEWEEIAVDASKFKSVFAANLQIKKTTIKNYEIIAVADEPDPIDIFRKEKDNEPMSTEVIKAIKAPAVTTEEQRINSISDMLFKQLQILSTTKDPNELTIEIPKSKAMANLAAVLLTSTTIQLKKRPLEIEAK